MKTLFISILSCISIPLFSQTHSVKDIEGLWQSTKAGAEIFLEIKDDKATITSTGNTSFPKKVVGGHMYENIRFSNNQWTAQRNAWKYPGTGGVNAEQGRFEKAENLTLTLSADKNTLTASGHWTYKRIDNKVSNEQVDLSKSRKTVESNLGGVKAVYYLISLENGKSYIIAKFTNTSSNMAASLKIKGDNGRLYTESLDPGVSLTRRYDDKNLEIEPSYKLKQGSANTSIIDDVKNLIRDIITTDKQDMKVTFVGGSRG